MPINQRRPLAGSLLVLSLLAACESRRPAALEAAAPPTLAPATSTTSAPADTVAAAPDSARAEPQPPGPPLTATTRRYVGTVGPLPVVLALTVADSVQGSYYYQGRGGRLRLRASRARTGQPLTLRETDPETGRPTGRWQTRQPAGPVLSGSWHSPDGRRQLPFTLREDYAGAVRYAIQTYTQLLKSGACGLSGDQQFVASLAWDKVQLLPPTSAVAARVQRRLDQEKPALEVCVETTETAEVTYNADFLLSIEWFRHEYAFNTPHPFGYYRHLTFDLRTGRPLALKELLRPGFELPLRRLLSERLRTDPGYADIYQGEIEGDSTQTRWPLGPDGQPLVELPRTGYYLTPMGVAFQYDTYEIAMYVDGPQLVEISYRDIRPLVRPGSPLARLLQRRGL